MPIFRFYLKTFIRATDEKQQSHSDNVIAIFVIMVILVVGATVPSL